VNAVLGAQAQLGNAGQNPGVPDRFNSVGSSPQGANGGNTPARHGPLPPTVIISPSAPVRAVYLVLAIFEVQADTQSSSMYLHLALPKPCRMT